MIMQKPDLKFYSEMSELLLDLADSDDRREAVKHVNSVTALLSEHIPGFDRYRFQLSVAKEANAPHRFREDDFGGMVGEDEE